jgi:nicotinate-nucleotide adenylyltransferase
MNIHRVSPAWTRWKRGRGDNFGEGATHFRFSGWHRASETISVFSLGRDIFSEVRRTPELLVMGQILVFGLSANPVHQAHVALVCEAMRALEARDYAIARALIVPVYRRNPVGSGKTGLAETYEHRVRLCELAAEEIRRCLSGVDTRVEVSRIAKQLSEASGEPNYTSETLATLRENVPSDAELLFLMSSDLVAGEEPEFARWHRIDKLTAQAMLIVCPRPGYTPNWDFLAALKQRGARVIYLDEVQTLDVSATEIRARLAVGESPKALSEEGLLLSSVALYLQEHNFLA